MKTLLMHKVTCLSVIFIMLTVSCQHGQGNNNHKATQKPVNQPTKKDTTWKSSARKMVENQIKSRGINDKQLLKVMKNTPRHRFIPAHYRYAAWDDNPLPIGFGQTISQPYIVALMTSQLELNGDEKVLEIGTGSAYQAAILAGLAKEVYTIEIVEELAISARRKLKSLEYDNVRVLHGDGYQGWPEHAPFDRIIVTAAPEKIPEKLLQQLKPGGIMVLPEGKNMQLLKQVTKYENGNINEEIITGVRFVPMVHPEENND
ncbi:MAG: protein-L-isoaspartate(D-aspartate) O-methyltransferase [Bacteroidales bacterium]|nr:protein-L-isoaspartate(D-aspartate) O-methyltransferase [Bacteroidales bacterium]